MIQFKFELLKTSNSLEAQKNILSMLPVFSFIILTLPSAGKVSHYSPSSFVPVTL